METMVGGQKCDWQHSMAHPRKSPYRRKNLADISYTDRVLCQILFHGNRCRSEKNTVCSIQWLIFKTPPPYRRKNLVRKPSYSPFFPNFVAMATGVGQEKCNWQHSMAHPRKPLCRRKNLAKISYASRVIAHFSQISLPWQRNLGKMGYNSACVRDFCEIFAPTERFSGMGHRMLPIAFFLTDPRCHGNEIWEKWAITRLAYEIFAPIGRGGFEDKPLNAANCIFFRSTPVAMEQNLAQNSVCVRDICEIFSSIGGFSGMGH